MICFKNCFMKRLSILMALTAAAFSLHAQNPILPMWEYIPDGEPYVFEDPDNPGKYRVYLYGSHDNLIDKYCGKDQVVWSAPVENLQDWRCDGIVFKSGDDILYAPDIARKKDSDGRTRYYFYPNNQAPGRNGMVAVGDRPDGPFKPINLNPDGSSCNGVLGFDPAVLVDDDGRVYGYWGFKESFAAELDPETMATVKPGTRIVSNLISGCNQEGVFRFFEASSIRKIEDKYILVYSRTTAEGEFGLPASNYNMAFAYSDNPLGPFTYGGTVIDCRGRDEDDAERTVRTAYFHGNTHGGLAEINGQWWIFFHRQTGTDQFSRQAMAAPVTVKVEKGKGGKVFISEAEYNSEGFLTEGLNPLEKSAAGWACYMTGRNGMEESFPNFTFSGSYIRPTRKDSGSHDTLQKPGTGIADQKPGTGIADQKPGTQYCPIVNNTDGSTVGYKYFNFDKLNGAEKLKISVTAVPLGVEGKIKVLIDRPYDNWGGQTIAEISIPAGLPAEMSTFETVCSNTAFLSGKKALYFVFESDTPDKSLCDFYEFQFIKQ